MITSHENQEFCFVLTLSPRLCAFLNKGILDSRLNSNNSCWKGVLLSGRVFC